jgi:hypothetical protein
LEQVVILRWEVISLSPNCQTRHSVSYIRNFLLNIFTATPPYMEVVSSIRGDTPCRGDRDPHDMALRVKGETKNCLRSFEARWIDLMCPIVGEALFSKVLELYALP